MARLFLWSLLLWSIQVISLFPKANAQDAALFVQGGFEDATATDDTYNTGGTISVNGFTIDVPKNMLVQFPAAWVPFKDFVADKTSMLGYEVNVSHSNTIQSSYSYANNTQVIGNFINGKPIAAQIITYEFFEGLASGFIESVNFADGSLKIQSGPTLRISDPNGVFSIGNTVAPFFTADDESPSISSFSGFPMCIPRNSSDPLCPATNRPFQGSGTFNVADPLSPAPFLAGDFITWSGIKKGSEVIAFSIVAQNVQITTLNDLVYLRMELALLGIDNFNPNTEIGESRFIGYTSNRRATVALYAMDYNPCTGAVTDRIIAAIGLRGGANEQNKFEYRSDILSGYAREYRVVAEIDGIPKTRPTKNGRFVAGTYVQPVNVWVQAEQAIPGTQPPANDFSQLPWLTQGVGADENGNIWGPLDPFPQTGVLIDVPVCDTISTASIEEPQERTWRPSSELLGYAPPVASAANETEPVPTTLITSVAPSATAEVPSSKAKRGTPRWLSEARAQTFALPEGQDTTIAKADTSSEAVQAAKAALGERL